MTLRGRLTAAFLAVVLGPVLLGALFVGGTVAAVGRDQAAERLGVAATALRTSVSSLCQQLQAAADAVAVAADPARQTDIASQVVARGLASGVVVEGADGVPTLSTPGSPARPWADCARPAPDAGPFRGPGRRGSRRGTRPARRSARSGPPTNSTPARSAGSPAPPARR